MKKKPIFFFLIFVVFAYSLYVFVPPILSKYHSIKVFKELNLEVKKLDYEKDFFEYVEGGKGQTLVFVHGFQSTKSYWVPYFQKFISNYNIIALDLPGHGNSSRPKNQKYDLQSMADSLALFIEKKKLNNFHLIGTSMGGGIAAIYVYNNPEKVKSLVLINPLGIDQKNKSDLQKLLNKGKNILFPKNLNEFDEMTLYLTGKQLSLSFYFKKYFLSQMIKNYDFFKKAFDEMLQKSKPLDNILPKIKTSTLILIGQKDRIIHPSSYEYFVKLMPNIKPIRFINGAHVFVDAYFDQAVKSIDEFLKDK